MPVHLRFIAAANSGENGAGSWRDSSISPGSGLEALHSYAGTVVDGVVRSEFSIVLLYEQKIWNVWKFQMDDLDDLADGMFVYL